MHKYLGYRKFRKQMDKLRSKKPGYRLALAAKIACHPRFYSYYKHGHKLHPEQELHGEALLRLVVGKGDAADAIRKIVDDGNALAKYKLVDIDDNSSEAGGKTHAKHNSLPDFEKAVGDLAREFNIHMGAYIEGNYKTVTVARHYLDVLRMFLELSGAGEEFAYSLMLSSTEKDIVKINLSQIGTQKPPIDGKGILLLKSLAMFLGGRFGEPEERWTRFIMRTLQLVEMKTGNAPTTPSISYELVLPAKFSVLKHKASEAEAETLDNRGQMHQISAFTGGT